VSTPPQESQDHPPVTSADSADATRAVTAVAGGTDDPEVEARAADRVIVFCDAVVAIAITLLALALTVPSSKPSTTNAQFLHDLGTYWDAYFAFLLSFVIIGNSWSAHRRVFRYVNRMNHQVSALNMIWLLMTILTPFAARLLAADGAFGARFTIYALIQIVSSSCFVLMNREISRANLLRPDAPAAAHHPDSSHSIAIIVMFLLSIPVAFATEWSYALWAVVPVLARVLRRRTTSGLSTPEAFAAEWAHAQRAVAPVLARVLRRRMTSGRHTASGADRKTW
jgi:uncharacterized membrane protein